MISRRQLLAGLGGIGGLGLSAGWIRNASAAEFVDLEWQDLIPPDGGEAVDRTGADGYVQHEELASGFVQPDRDAGVVGELDNQRVRISGFMVPVVMLAEGVTSFLLVPYMGACVHVPPPPPNQIVFVTTATPWSDGTLFRAIRVTGRMETHSVTTDLAEVGYVLDAEQIELFEGQYA